MLTLSCLPGIGILGCLSPSPLPLPLLFFFLAPGIPLLSPPVALPPTSLPGLSPEALLGPVPPPTPIVLYERRIVRWDPWGPIAWLGDRGGERILREYDMQGRLTAEVRLRESREACEITARKFGSQGEVLLERTLPCRVVVIRYIVPVGVFPPPQGEVRGEGARSILREPPSPFELASTPLTNSGHRFSHYHSPNLDLWR